MKEGSCLGFLGGGGGGYGGTDHIAVAVESSCCGGGGGSSSKTGGSNMSTIVSKEEDNLNLVLSSTEVSSYPSHESESELELSLGLSLGGPLFKSLPTQTQTLTPWNQRAVILAPQHFPNSLLTTNSSSSSSSSSVTKDVVSAATKTPPHNHVVGWPPLKRDRMNNFVSRAKSPATEEFDLIVGRSKRNNCTAEKTSSGSNGDINAKENGHRKTSLFVKVNMDGILIGRKVDLNAHRCYETLVRTLEDMFGKPTTSINARCIEEQGVMNEATGSSKLLYSSSKFVLTYEDKEGDWMLLGDVPWGMFISSVKRLRIMRTAEANGLGFQERNARQRK
ncbi:auxin-responsive protein IAA13-like isoform X2 [Cornus florida]|uniref:auxin-responsive protein IAA13-like isoform X2 n=1 Tax=Cornus florida TaxID=4283 RepID=UPI002899DD0F|nr:auxin-responsive protein IAA13-like isoform X2 [Cornus florida]